MNVSAGGKMCFLQHRSDFAAENLLPHKGDKTPPKSVFSRRLSVSRQNRFIVKPIKNHYGQFK
jgi:hypothetical protein